MKCTAHLKSGAQCKNNSILGGNVCRYHGGAAPQVQLKARERLALLIDPAIGRLGKLIKSKNEQVALGASKDALDRNGFKPKDHTVVEQHDSKLAKALSEVFTPEELVKLSEHFRDADIAGNDSASDTDTKPEQTRPLVS